MESQFQIPTEVVELPSKGLLYAKESPLSSGEIELKVPTSKEEDILTNPNFIKNGTVIDKFLRSLIVDKNINYGDLLVGDKDALLVAGRILLYGSKYEISHKNRLIEVNLTELKSKEVDFELLSSGENEFSFTLPRCKFDITYKLLTHGDEVAIEKEIAGLMKNLKLKTEPSISTRLKYMITSVNGDRDIKTIRQFADKIPSQDSRALRQEYSRIAPGVEFKAKVVVDKEEGIEEDVDVPVGLKFFWPDF